MDEIAKEYDVIVLGTGMPLPPPLLLESPPASSRSLGLYAMDGDFGVSILC